MTINLLGSFFIRWEASLLVECLQIGSGTEGTSRSHPLECKKLWEIACNKFPNLSCYKLFLRLNNV